MATTKHRRRRPTQRTKGLNRVGTKIIRGQSIGQPAAPRTPLGQQDNPPPPSAAAEFDLMAEINPRFWWPIQQIPDGPVSTIPNRGRVYLAGGERLDQSITAGAPDYILYDGCPPGSMVELDGGYRALRVSGATGYAEGPAGNISSNFGVIGSGASPFTAVFVVRFRKYAENNQKVLWSNWDGALERGGCRFVFMKTPEQEGDAWQGPAFFMSATPNSRALEHRHYVQYAQSPRQIVFVVRHVGNVGATYPDGWATQPNEYFKRDRGPVHTTMRIDGVQVAAAGSTTQIDWRPDSMWNASLFCDQSYFGVVRQFLSCDLLDHWVDDRIVPDRLLLRYEDWCARHLGTRS